MWNCIKECFSIIFPAIGIWTIIVLVGVVIAGLVAAGATGGVGGAVVLGIAKAALINAGIAFGTSALGALLGCIGGCKIVQP
jgi:hypothetical protein